MAVASVAIKLKVAETAFVVPDGPEVIVVSGGVLSTVALTAAEIAELLELSTARAEIATAPSVTEAEFQVMPYGAVLSVPTTLLLTRKSTWSTAILSLALAARVTGPLSSAPFDGAVTETVGDVLSAGVVTEAGALAPDVFPAASRARTSYW